MRGIVTDIETTGFKRTSAIISISMVKFNGYIIEEIFSTLVNPQTKIPPEIVKLTGIDDMKVIGHPTLPQLKSDILYFVEKLPILAYNAPFEVRFIGSLLQRRGNLDESIDILKAVKKVIKLDSYKLKDVATHFGINFYNFHFYHHPLLYNIRGMFYSAGPGHLTDGD